MSMLVDALESMMKGEDGYPRAFAAAKTFWDAFYAEHGEADDAALQRAVDRSQTSFEHQVGEASGLVRPFVKSIMAVTAIGALYQDGFEDREALAKRMVRALAKSTSLSLEVKSSTKEAAAIYGLHTP